METHSLPLRQTDGDQPPPLTDGRPALRVEPSDRTVVAVNEGMASLIGRGVEEIVGCALNDLWAQQERAAITARFDDVVLLGHDVFGAIAVVAGAERVVWVQVDARFFYRDGQRLDVVFEPLGRTSGADGLVVPLAAADSERDGAEHDGVDAPDPDSDTSEVVNPAGGPDAPDDTESAEDSETAEASDAVEAADDAENPEASDAAESPEDSETAGEPNAPHASETAAAADVLDAPPGAHEAQSPADDRADADLAATVMATLEAAGAPALWIDAGGTVVSATRCAGRELGLEVADIRGQPLHDVVVLSSPARDALDVARRGRMRQTVLDGGDASDHKHVVEWVPGSEHGAGFVVFSTPGANKDPGDTERLRLQSQLVSHVSHDLRGAMTAVFCGLQVVADGLPEGDPLHESVEQALDDSRRANRIIDEVLAVSRPGRQKRADVDLSTLLRDTIDHHRQLAESRSIELVADLGDGHYLTGDSTKLDRAFSNVIDNALLATPEGGSVSVLVVPEARTHPGAHVTIADTGSGIPAELQPNVFEPFVSDRDGGSGLGLAITRRIVLEHDGQIDFETEEGVGTTFHIWLPCTP